METSGETTTIHYKAKDYEERTTVEAVYTDPDGETHTVKLPARAPGEYEAKIDTDIPGIYNLSVRRSDDGELKNAITTAAVAQYSDEYKFAADNERFLSFMERYGKVIKPSDSFWKKLKTNSRAAYDLSKWLLILAIAWFLLDVAVRRFAFVPQDSRLYRQVKSYFTKRKEKAIMTADRKNPMRDSDAGNEKNVSLEGQDEPMSTLSGSLSDEKPAKAKKKKKKQEEAALDTSALLKKKDLRDQ